jgi:hypothetical protein
VDTVRNNITIDWDKKESIRARLRVSVKRLLRKYGYPPEKQEKATLTVLEQAEGLTLELTKEMIIDRVYNKDSQQNVAKEKSIPVTITERIRQRENDNRELKSSFRYDFNENMKRPNPRLEKVIAKTVSAFMNASGGNLFIGVSDDGNILGLEQDYLTLKKQNSDAFEIEVRQSVEKYTRNKMANEYMKFEFHKVEGKEICEITVSSTPKPVFIYDEGGKQQECYVRIGNASKPYTLDEFWDYWPRRLGSS